MAVLAFHLTLVLIASGTGVKSTVRWRGGHHCANVSIEGEFGR
jgi:hypothetical protein